MRSSEYRPRIGSSFYSNFAGAAMRLALLLPLASTAQAQTYQVLHNFTRGNDGQEPQAGLTIDRGGNLYGTAAGDLGGTGTVFRMKNSGSGWIFSPLFAFNGTSSARVTIGPDGSLFGSTSFGGGSGAGTVFNLRPPVTFCRAVSCPWRRSFVYLFRGDTDGERPSGDLTFDAAGNIYGTAAFGGDAGFNGVVYQLQPSGGGWAQNVIYTFHGGNDGSEPNAGVIFDNASNLYGTALAAGANGFGTVFQLTPSGSGWTETTIYAFQNGEDGAYPSGGLVKDASGNLIGVTSSGGSGGGGTVFMLSPANGGWAFSLIHSFPGQFNGGPLSSLTADAAGNLYGTTHADGAHGFGSVFKLSPSGGSWTYTTLYDFAGQTDGSNPIGGAVADPQGSVFGTTSAGGISGAGVVFEITP